MIKSVAVFLFLIGVSISPLNAAPVVRLGLNPPEALPGLPVKFEITVDSSDGTATSIPNQVALLVTKPDGERFLAGSTEEVHRFPAMEGDRIEIPARKAVDLTFWYNAPWTVDCRLQQPGEYTFQLIVGTDPVAALSSGATGLLLSNEARLRVINPEGEDAKAYAVLKDPTEGCLKFHFFLTAEVWEKYPDSTYAMHLLPTPSDPMSPTSLQEQIGIFRESLRRWPNSPLIESTRLGLAEELIMLTGDRDLATALASARESQGILTDLSRNANNSVIRKAAADALENRAYTEQEVLDEFKAEKHTRLTPFVECVAPISVGMRVWFGIANPTAHAVSVPVGSRNKMTPAPQDRGQLTNFPAGIRHLAFSVDVDGPVLDWHLDGTNVQAMLAKSFQCPPNMDEYLKDLPRKD